MVSESKTFLHIVVLTFHLWTSHIPMFNSVLSRSVTPSYHREKVESVYGVPAIESGRRSLIHHPLCLSKKVLYTSIKSFPWWSAIFFSLGLGSFSIIEIKVANPSRFLHFSSINRSISSFVMKNRTGMCCAEWPNILVLSSVQCIHLVWRAQCARLKQQKTINPYKLYYIYTSAGHFYWLYEFSASYCNLLVYSSSQVFPPMN